jgi:cellobiose phosphorylase
MSNLFKFNNVLGTFSSLTADKLKSLYFPLCNESLISSVSPDLHGDIKTGQDAFLLQPVSRIDLTNLKSSRNFWVYIDKNKIWSATGVYKNIAQLKKDEYRLEAGLLWHKVIRVNRQVGIKSEILNFIPSSGEPVEIMLVTLTNISGKNIRFIPTAAIPLYARSANSLRDHRHVTSLLQRVAIDRFGVMVKPTMLFDESGHHKNHDIYFVLGVDSNGAPPKYIYPTQETFCGEAGDLEAPQAIFENKLPDKSALIQGKDTMGGLRFPEAALKPGASRSYIVLMGIDDSESKIKGILKKFNTLSKVNKSLSGTKDFWFKVSNKINIKSKDPDFDNWFRWVNVQPALRKIFGCSFLPDFDYGKGGRGWRDLWQDCLGLILNSPEEAGKLLINNFGGVRIDGSNATIIGKKAQEFIADRNDIARVWMDHGVWPLLTLDLYVNETGDYGILSKEISYFYDQHIYRSRLLNKDYKSQDGNLLKTKSGKVYRGSVLEHLLVQNLAQFFNVGRHNFIRLEGADWNDGLDMAKENGESIAFSCMYAHNLDLIASLIERSGIRRIDICAEMKVLLDKVDYASVVSKRKRLDSYFAMTAQGVSGRKLNINAGLLVNNLREKSRSMSEHIRKSEWLKEGFFNGYYDNKGLRIEGKNKGIMRMMLATCAFSLMSGVADDKQAKSILNSAKKYLWDSSLGGFRLNTDFKDEQYDLGRAFSFVYGDKENGAIFSHMVVMFAYGLYKRKLNDAGWKALSSLYKLAIDTEKSKIYPSLPEYFNAEGRGMYSYLTGSASWFVLTMLTQVFGVRGRDGDLLIEPKLSPELFKNGSINLTRSFAGRVINVRFSSRGQGFKIVEAYLNGVALPVCKSSSLVISRKKLQKFRPSKTLNLEIILG